MAFMLAHPAAILPLVPLLKRRGVPSALVIGSMSPDLPTIMHLGAFRDHSHALSGFFVFCLPMGLLLLTVFHRYLKRPLIATLPDRVQQALAPYSDSYWLFSRHRPSAVILSLAIGVITHIAWDQITHGHSSAAAHCSILCMTVFEGWGHELRMYKFLQYSTSLLGLVMLYVYALNWLRSQPYVAVAHTPRLTRRQRCVILGTGVLVPLLVGVESGWTALHASAPTLHQALSILRHAISTSVTSFGIIAVGYAAIYIACQRANKGEFVLARPPHPVRVPVAIR